MRNCLTVTIQSCKMQDIPLHTEVFNLAEIPDIICVKLPDILPRHMDLSGIFDLNTNKDIEYAEHVTRNEHRPWIDIDKEILDLSVGQHIYRMTFQDPDPEHKLTAICWFSYIIQNTFVDKPYIYMTEAIVESDIPKGD